jgi:FKBP-type peptidyl-prolyl cis-trans isomerase FkpA
MQRLHRVFFPLFPLLGVTLLAQTPPAKPAAPKAATKAATKAAPRAASTAPALTTDDQKTIYALGFSMYQSLAPFQLSPAELQIVKRAFADAAAGKPAIPIDPWQPKIGALRMTRASAGAQKVKANSQAFLAKAAAAPGAVKTDSGLIYRELKPGTGASPAATDTVKVNYRGTFPDGKEFDSSKEPITFPLNHVIKCWTEGVQKMKVGGKASLVCPSDIAYGDAGRPSIPGGSTLVFEVELLDIVKPAK